MNELGMRLSNHDAWEWEAGMLASCGVEPDRRVVGVDVCRLFLEGLGSRVWGDEWAVVVDDPATRGMIEARVIAVHPAAVLAQGSGNGWVVIEFSDHGVIGHAPSLGAEGKTRGEAWALAWLACCGRRSL